MLWFGEYTYMGLEIVRINFGERAYQGILRFCKKNTRSESDISQLHDIGKLVGLNAAEVEQSTSSTISSVPWWLKIVLIAIAVIFGALYTLIYFNQTSYVPGTDYASIKPNDFENISIDSILMIARNQYGIK